jgi:predicted  nucleic acid-binding Zn-ribbon protein
MNYSKKGIKLTNQEYDLRLLEYKLKRLEDYIDSKTSIKHVCINCNKIFRVKPKELNRINCDCFLKGAEYKKNIYNKNIVPIENYRNIKSKILHKCLNCQLEFYSSPKTILKSKIGCTSCSGKKFTEEKYKSLLPSNIELIGEYIDTAKATLHKCLECDNKWTTKPNYILHMGCGCPNCASSKGEKLIQKLLEDLSIYYLKEKNVEIYGFKYRFDFFIDNLNLFIEFDGIQHFESKEFFGGDEYFKKIQESDKIKNNWCVNNRYKLIRITYKELKTLTKEQLSELIYN